MLSPPHTLHVCVSVCYMQMIPCLERSPCQLVKVITPPLYLPLFQNNLASVGSNLLLPWVQLLLFKKILLPLPDILNWTKFCITAAFTPSFYFGTAVAFRSNLFSLLLASYNIILKVRTQRWGAHSLFILRETSY